MSIGYACILLGAPECALRSLTLKNATEDKLKEIILHNLITLDKIIDYNIKNNIKLFRISSDIIPFASHPSNTSEWWLEYADMLTALGLKIKASGMRVSMHPGQYTIINSPSGDVVENSINELAYHARFLDAMNVDSSNKLILHIGGVYGDKAQATQRFIDNYKALPQNIKDRLVIENDERCYSIEEVLDIGEKLSIPVVFDNLHNEINPSSLNHSPIEWIKLCSKTWKPEKDGMQKIHYSQQAVEGKLGSHSQTINITKFMDFYNAIENKPDIMLEVKDKNISALKCIHAAMENVPIKLLENEWAKYKYLILSHSHNIYLEIRELLKQKTSLSAQAFYEKLEEGLKIESSIGSETNAAEHVWGYFKDIADLKEKNKFIKLKEDYSSGNIKIHIFKNFLFKLTIKYDVEYLKYSYYFV